MIKIAIPCSLMRVNHLDPLCEKGDEWDLLLGWSPKYPGSLQQDLLILFDEIVSA